MEKSKKAMYIFEFDICQCQENGYMHSKKGKKNSFKVTNDHIKIGETGDYEGRLKGYNTTYKCSFCRKINVKEYKSWEVDFGKETREDIETEIKKEFPHLHEGGRLEYYRMTKGSDKEKIKNKMQELIDQKNSNKFKD